jgi:2',3'-cyclic-nucleotide 2'-phosphodiesterase (5'-nucleotidase family)
MSLILTAGCGSRDIPEGTVVTFLYSSDVRGALTGCGCQQNGAGIARRSAEIAAARSTDGSVVYCDVGNFMSGTAQADSSRGAVMIDAYNHMKASVVNVSEREVAYGVDAFKAAKKNAKFDFVSANVIMNGSVITEPFVIKKVKEARVAFVGLCGTRETMRSDAAILPSDITVEDPFKAARRVLPAIAGKADLIVILSTCGDEVDSSLATSFPEVDMIVGGRSFRFNAFEPWVIGKTRIVRAQRDGRTLGRMDLEFGTERKIKTYVPAELRMNVDGTVDNDMMAVVKKHVPGFVDHPSAVAASQTR